MTRETPASAFDLLDRLRTARATAGNIMIGLDFDGTLAALVPRPADAALLDGAAAVLERLAARDDTTVAVITGRAVSDVRRRVAMHHIHYAGNHGLEIEGPAFRWTHADATAAQTALASLRTRLRDALAEWPEIIIEDKTISLSVHFRTVTDPAVDARIVARVKETMGDGGGVLRTTGGRKVVEIRPAIDWDKGHALNYLKEQLGLRNAPAIFIGDDRTDEDAFREMQGVCDVGIVVGRERLAETRATAVLDSPRDVIQFLAALAVA